MSTERNRHQKLLRIAMLEMLAITAGLHWQGFYPGTKAILANNTKYTILLVPVYYIIYVNIK